MNRILPSTRWLQLAAAALFALPAAAQTPPAPPALRPPPERGAWTVSYKSVKPARQPDRASPDDVMVDASAATAEVKRRDFTVNGQIAKCVTHYTDGKTVTAYVFGLLGVMENPGDPKDLVVSDFSSPWMAGGDFRTRYPGLEWVRPQHYKGTAMLGKVLCHYFAEGKAPPPAPGKDQDIMPDPEDFAIGGREAWLTADGRPLQSKDASATSTYSFKPADADAAIEVPERFKNKARRYIKALSPLEAELSGKR
jgi:hypothetical protein